MMRSVNWPSLQDRRLHCSLLRMYKTYYNLVDTDWKDYLTLYTSTTRGHSSRFFIIEGSWSKYLYSSHPLAGFNCTLYILHHFNIKNAKSARLRGVEWVHCFFLFPLVLGKMLLSHAKIGSFLCSVDNLLQKNVIVFFFENQISKWRSFERKGYF